MRDCVCDEGGYLVYVCDVDGLGVGLCFGEAGEGGEGGGIDVADG